MSRRMEATWLALHAVQSRRARMPGRSTRSAWTRTARLGSGRRDAPTSGAPRPDMSSGSVRVTPRGQRLSVDFGAEPRTACPACQILGQWCNLAIGPMTEVVVGVEWIAQAIAAHTGELIQDVARRLIKIRPPYLICPGRLAAQGVGYRGDAL